MKNPYVTLIVSTAGLFLSPAVRAQYYATEVNVSSTIVTPPLFRAVSASDFDDTKTVSRTIDGGILSWTPAVRAKGVTLSQIEGGLLLGRQTVNRKWHLGMYGNNPILPGSYFLWVARAGKIWKSYCTDAAGQIIASSNEVNLDFDADTTGPLFAAGMAHITVPPYSPVSADGNLTLLADEGPGTVHGCQCRNVKVCYMDAFNRIICVIERVCSCWN